MIAQTPDVGSFTRCVTDVVFRAAVARRDGTAEDPDENARRLRAALLHEDALLGSCVDAWELLFNLTLARVALPAALGARRPGAAVGEVVRRL